MTVYLNSNTLVLPHGVLAYRRLNKTGATSVHGTVVRGGSASDAVVLPAAAGFDTIGVVVHPAHWVAGVADGEYIWVVTHGRCQVLLQDATGSTIGYWVYPSQTVVGRADASNAEPPGGGFAGSTIDHFKEIGHSLQTVGGGTDVLCWIDLHHN
jgi:hypothetical protein